MAYVDGFLLAVPKSKVQAYRRIATRAGKTWKKYGALAYMETVGDDLKVSGNMGVAFPKVAKAKPSETVVFSWIVYKSKAHRNAVNKKVMADPAMSEMMNDSKSMPFDVKKMAYGGFKSLVEL